MVECQPSKLYVAGSSPVTCSNLYLIGELYGKKKKKKRFYRGGANGARLQENVFAGGNPLGWGRKPTEIGRRQFYEYQTKGLHKHPWEFRPEYLDTYFYVLKEGKFSFDLMTSEYKKMWENGEWWGWQTLMDDWKENLWMLKYLCSWRKNIPQQIEDDFIN